MSAGFSSVIKTLTMVMQSAAITTGAALVLSQEISPGVMIRAALLLGRSLSLCKLPLAAGVLLLTLEVNTSA